MQSFKSSRKPIASLLILLMAFFAIVIAPAQAAMIDTGQVIRQARHNADRVRLHNFLQRQDVRKQLEAWGIDSREAQARVTSLSDDEIAQITDRLDQLPAGGDAFVAIVVASVVIFIALLITDILGYTDVFPFVKK